LEGVGGIPTQEELTESNLLEEEVKKQLSDDTARLESTEKWKLSATRGYKDTMRDQDDLPFEEEV
jgi:hypothetical protein